MHSFAGRKVIKNERISVVLDTDAFNEVDDQFAIAYLLCSQDRLDSWRCMPRLLLTSKRQRREMAWKSAAGRSAIGKLLRLMGEDKPFYRGSPV